MPHLKPDINKFRKRLNDFRNDTLDKTAKKLDVGKRTYQDWINPHKEKWPSVDNLIKLANTYEVTTDYILGVSDYQTPENNDIGKEIGLTDEAITKLRQMNQTGHTELLQVISDLLTNPIADEILQKFIELYAISDLEKDKSLEALSAVMEKYSQKQRQLANKADIDHVKLTEQELFDFGLNGSVVSSIVYLLKKDRDGDRSVTYQEISRLAANLAESYYQSKAGD